MASGGIEGWQCLSGGQAAYCAVSPLAFLALLHLSLSPTSGPPIPVSWPPRRLNWQLHFGEPPRWSSGVKFVLLDVEPSDQDAAKAALVLRGDAGTGATALLAALRQGQPAGTPLLPGAAASGWLAGLQGKVVGAREKLAAKMARTAFPLDYQTTLRVVRDELSRLPKPAVVVSEGANTMDNAR